jgi:hypothetical protein
MIGTEPKISTCGAQAARVRRLRILCASLGALLHSVRPTIAHADEVASRNLAEQLFSDGKRLMAAGKFDEACPKLAESERLDPAGGTILNLAVCHEGQGRFASAWSEFREALGRARTEGRPDREQFALEHLAQVEPKVSHLTLSVEPKARAPGLTIKLDDEAVGEAAWNSSLPVDAGSHEVTASAPGKVDRRRLVQVIGTADTMTVTIPPLEDAPIVSGSAPSAESAAEVSFSDPRRGKRIAGFVVGGVGLVSLGVGAVFGVEALQRRRDSDAFCSGNTCRAQSGVALNDDAQRFAIYADVGLGVGIVGLAVGTFLVLTSNGPRPMSASTAVRLNVVPVVGMGSSGLDLSGTW